MALYTTIKGVVVKNYNDPVTEARQLSQSPVLAISECLYRLAYSPMCTKAPSVWKSLTYNFIPIAILMGSPSRETPWRLQVTHTDAGVWLLRRYCLHVL